MGKRRRTDRYRAVTLTLTETGGGWVGALFASTHSGADVDRRLVARHIVVRGVESNTVDDLCTALRAALDELESSRYTPPR